MSNKYKTLGVNTILMMIGTVGAKVINLVMLPFYTKWLDTAEFGISDTITVYATLLVSVVSLCIDSAVFVFPKNKPVEKIQSYFTSGVIFLLFMTLVTFFVFSVIRIAVSVEETDTFLGNYLWEILLLLLSNVFLIYNQQFVRSINKIVIFSLTGILVTASTAILAFFLIPNNGVSGFVMSFIMSNFAGGLFAIIFAKSYTFFSYKFFQKSYLKEMLKYSIPLVPNAVMWWVVSSINRPLLTSYCGYDDVGLYAVANKFPGILTIIFSVFNSSWQISVLDEFGKDGYDKFYNSLLRFMVVTSSIMLALITIFSKSLTTLFTSSEFFIAWKYVPILSLGVFFLNISGFVGANFSAVRESKYYFFSSVWAAIVAVALNVLLIPFIGLWGASLSTMASFAVMAVARIIYSWKYVHVSNMSFYVFLVLANVLMYFLVLQGKDFVAVIGCVFFVLFCAWHERVIAKQLLKRTISRMKK